LDNRDVWLQIAKLADLALSNHKEWGSRAQAALRFSSIFEGIQTKPEFKTISKKIVDKRTGPNHLLRSLPKIINRIVYSRIFSQHWKEWV
jgi:hypothetical protein